jgi:hypothetical protein
LLPLERIGFDLLLFRIPKELAPGGEGTLLSLVFLG